MSNMRLSRSESVSITAHSGPTLAIHTRTHDEEDLPHATKRCVAFTGQPLGITKHRQCVERWPITLDVMKACAQNSKSCFKPLLNSLRFTLTPPRMRMIVEAFKEALELGLEKPGQVVVRIKTLSYPSRHLIPSGRCHFAMYCPGVIRFTPSLSECPKIAY